jgi:PEP-CTERM motif
MNRLFAFLFSICALGICTAARASQLDLLRDPSTVATYTGGGSPESLLGPGGWTGQSSGQGPSISTTLVAQFVFPQAALVSEITLNAYTSQHVTGETNQGTSTTVVIERLESDGIWHLVIFDRPYENNWDGGPGNFTDYTFALDLTGLPELSGDTFGLRFTLDSRGYSNTPPGIPFIEVNAVFNDVTANGTVPEPSTAVLLGLGLAGCAWWKRGCRFSHRQ